MNLIVRSLSWRPLRNPGWFFNHLRVLPYPNPGGRAKRKFRYSIDFEKKTLLYDHLSIGRRVASRLVAEPWQWKPILNQKERSLGNYGRSTDGGENS